MIDYKMTSAERYDLQSAIDEFVRGVQNAGDDASWSENVQLAIRLVEMQIQITGSLYSGISRLYSEAARMSDM
jgi:hypothetical protein